MSELRRDPVAGYWTIIATERSRRPIEFVPKIPAEERPCPFCEGKEAETTGEVYAIRRAGTKPNAPGWSVRAIRSKMPLLDEPDGTERSGIGLYDVMQASGAHEIIIESPRHAHGLDELSVPDIENVIRVYRERVNSLSKDERYRYALLFKNHGLISGSAKDVIQHTRSQLIGLPVTPKRVKEELIAAKNYYERHKRCVFCDVMRQESIDGTRTVSENPSFYAFCPFASRVPFESWILPKKHMSDFGKIDDAAIGHLSAILKDCLTKLKTLLNDPPYNLILHTAPYRHKEPAGGWGTIEEDFHWYLQISPRLAREAGFEWGTGIHINPTPPEDAAGLLRGSA